MRSDEEKAWKIGAYAILAVWFIYLLATPIFSFYRDNHHLPSFLQAIGLILDQILPIVPVAIASIILKKPTLAKIILAFIIAEILLAPAGALMYWLDKALAIQSFTLLGTPGTLFEFIAKTYKVIGLKTYGMMLFIALFIYTAQKGADDFEKE
ncbi:hypothetical protein J7K99_08370 [bacterium]|nr:hypothetical protein [bacterium]